MADESKLGDGSEEFPPPTTAAGSSTVELPGWFAVTSALSFIAWVVAGAVALVQWFDFSEQRDSYRISAPQISQIADEYLVTVLPWFVVAIGLTAVALLLGLTHLIQLVARR